MQSGIIDRSICFSALRLAGRFAFIFAALTWLAAAVPAQPLPCVADCDASNEVTVEEIVRAVNIALGSSAIGQCSAADANGDGEVTIDEILTAVNAAILGCVGMSTPTPTSIPTPTATINPNVWRPSLVYPSLDGMVRGFLDRRGLIHAHSVYSHDACDGEPVKNGERDPICFDDFRRGLCQARHDFVFLTDHASSFAEYDYPELMLYRPERGDELVNREGKPRASWAACPDQSPSLIVPGTESTLMPVGLEEQVADTKDERRAVYNSGTAEAADAERAKGAVVLVSHTENWTLDELLNLHLDGFEMYNIHANLLRNPGPGLRFILRLGEPNLPHPDLTLLEIISEDSLYLKRWGSVLASGARKVTTMGTDCHRNTFQQLMSDGERVDSYRRLMIWFSNHLLIRPDAEGKWDDRDLKEALLANRLYGAFEVMGYPEGFDYHAEVGSQISEIGSEVTFDPGLVLSVTPPQVRNLDPARTPPVLNVRLLRATPDGFTEVASGPGALRYTVSEPGAYRAEVRMKPLHLREDMGVDADALLSHDYVWIYSNAIYVR